METRATKLRRMNESMRNSLHAERILSQLSFLLEVSGVKSNAYDDQLLPVIDKLYDEASKVGAITKEMAIQYEQTLLPLADVCKAYEITCIAHAHIDMNWMWGYQETASLTIDTFNTMLRLMDEYPEFTFSQSQASVYEIVEKYHPQMLEKIKKRVHEGRWEVTASTWVEHDSNLSGEESFARHLLYTKRYLSELLDIPQSSLELNFEPDTFGHNINVPEIMNRGGVKYYYHCRGYSHEMEHIYNWRSPSGAEILVYREPHWYNQTISYDLFYDMPYFCKKNNTNKMMKVYGVGDHGGGPTRRDINRLIEMSGWPLFPRIKFGTLHGFFKELELERANFNTVEQELNYVFTGCYTSQSRIKRANHIAEDRLLEAEALDAQAKILANAYRTAGSFEQPWRKVLFNQFHDILPGSGVMETREYAMGIYQQSLAGSLINANHATSSIADQIDTSGIIVYPDDDIAIGAGVGYYTEEAMHYKSTAPQRGTGVPRIYHLFNTTPFERTEVVELTLWDWPEDIGKIAATTATGQPLETQVLSRGEHYWGHTFHQIAVLATVPPMGYTTCLVTHTPENTVTYVHDITLEEAPRQDCIDDAPIILENEHLKVTFDQRMKIISMVDKSTNRQLIDGLNGAGCFTYTEENPLEGMTSWRVGKRAQVVDINDSYPVMIQSFVSSGIRQQVRYTVKYLNSSLDVTIVLDKGAQTLRYDVQSDWREFGSPDRGIPQLGFNVPLAFSSPTYRCGIQYGTIDRPELAHDVPCIDFMAALPATGQDKTLVLMSDSKYGFRGFQNVLSVNLLRGSYDPDPSPEIAKHSFSLGISLVDPAPENIKAVTEPFIHSIYSCTNSVHEGNLPSSGSLLKLDGELVLSALKQSEDGKGLIVRLYNPKDEDRTATLTFAKNVQTSHLLNMLEEEQQPIEAEGNTLKVALPKRAVYTYKVVL